MNQSASPVALCPCGSGLAYPSCCGGPPRQPSPEQRNDPRVAGEIEVAVADINAGRRQAAEQRVRALLREVPGLLRGLDLLISLRRQAGDRQATDTLLARRARLYPNYDVAQFEYAVALTAQGRGREAEAVLKKLLEHHPHHADAHNLLGQLTIQNLGTLQKAEYHLRQAYYIRPQVAFYSVKLAHVLRLLGRWEEAIHFLRIALALEPGNLEALQCWVGIEESRHDIERAWQLQRVAMANAPEDFRNRLNQALLHRRSRQYGEALAVLDGMDRRQFTPSQQAIWHFERGHVLDKLARYPEAFADFDAANRQVRTNPARRYDVDANARRIAQCKRYFTRARLRGLPRGRPQRDGEETPIFVVGFPRSGTSMLEQILSTHPDISGGNELILAQRLTENARGWLGSARPYPDCLDDLARPEHRAALQRFRNYYLGELRTLAILDPGTRLFTDKMPLNEVHLGMLSLVFPEAHIVHLLRHPLDIITSCYFNELQHGDNFAFDLECAARHYVLVMDLVEHYRRELDMHYHCVRYEDLVTDIETQARQLIDFIGVAWDPRCLDFHENARAARTASYAQVKERVHTRSVNRYQHYRAQLEPIIDLIRPAAERAGYEIV